MIFSKKLFISNSVKKNKNIMKTINLNKSVLGIYFVCINKNANNMFEIFTSREYFKKEDNFNKYIIVGIVKGRIEALEYIKNIFEDFYSQNLNFKDLKSYFK